MLKLGKTYRIFRGKVTTGGNNTMLSISESSKDPKTGEWKNQGWWSVCVNGQFPCERTDEVKFTIDAITAVSQREYNGKNYITVFADGKCEYKGSIVDTKSGASTAKEDSGGQIIGNTEDLPF